MYSKSETSQNSTSSLKNPSNSWILSKYLDVGIKYNKLTTRRKRKSRNFSHEFSSSQDENIEPPSSDSSDSSGTNNLINESTSKQKEVEYFSGLKKLFNESCGSPVKKKRKKVGTTQRKALQEVNNSEEFEIESVDSQKSEENLEDTIENPSSPQSASYEIENYENENRSSHSSSQLTISICDSPVNNNNIDKDSTLDIISPKHKKRYKKGTLSHSFQVILKKYRANFSIWKHEIYLSKTSTYQIPATENDYLITTLSIDKIESDFGMKILTCHNVSGKRELCVVNTNINSIELNELDRIKIFPPFFVKMIQDNEERIKCYVNVSKIVVLDLLEESN